MNHAHCGNMLEMGKAIQNVVLLNVFPAVIAIQFLTLLYWYAGNVYSFVCNICVPNIIS